MSYQLLGELGKIERPKALAPTLALLFYGSTVLKHPVLDTETGYELGAGAFMSAEDMNLLGQALADRGIIRTRPNTLGCSPYTLIWWVPPGERPLQFEAKYHQTQAIASLNGRPIPHPGLVMVATLNTLTVYAVRGHKRPNDDTPLCAAPFWNMFENHQMCRGSVRYPEAVTPDTQEAWEEAFFASTFTGPSRQDKYLNWPKSYQELLEKALELGTFPEDVLTDAGLTLGQLLTT